MAPVAINEKFCKTLLELPSTTKVISDDNPISLDSFFISSLTHADNKPPTVLTGRWRTSSTTPLLTVMESLEETAMQRAADAREGEEAVGLNNDLPLKPLDSTCVALAV